LRSRRRSAKEGFLKQTLPKKLAIDAGDQLQDPVEPLVVSNELASDP
jgi:hypothetical protein